MTIEQTAAAMISLAMWVHDEMAKIPNSYEPMIEAIAGEKMTPREQLLEYKRIETRFETLREVADEIERLLPTPATRQGGDRK